MIFFNETITNISISFFCRFTASGWFLPIRLPNGEDGLLAKGQLGDAVKDLSQYNVSEINDQRLLSGR